MLFDAIHTEQAFLRLLKEKMPGSRWNDTISHADIAIFSAAENFLKITYVLLL